MVSANLRMPIATAAQSLTTFAADNKVEQPLNDARAPFSFVCYGALKLQLAQGV